MVGRSNSDIYHKENTKEQTSLNLPSNVNSHNKPAITGVLLHQKLQLNTIWEAYESHYKILLVSKPNFASKVSENLIDLTLPRIRQNMTVSFQKS